MCWRAAACRPSYPADRDRRACRTGTAASFDNTPLGLRCSSVQHRSGDAAIDAHRGHQPVSRCGRDCRATIARRLRTGCTELQFANKTAQGRHAARGGSTSWSPYDRGAAAAVPPGDRVIGCNTRLDDAWRNTRFDRSAIANNDMQDRVEHADFVRRASADDKDGMRTSRRIPSTAASDGFTFAQASAARAREARCAGLRRMMRDHKIAAGRPKPARRAQRSALDNTKPS